MTQSAVNCLVQMLSHFVSVGYTLPQLGIVMNKFAGKHAHLLKVIGLATIMIATTLKVVNDD